MWSASSRREPPYWHLFLFVATVGVAMFIVALTGFPNLMDNERRVGGYVLDAVQNGHWMVQRDATGEVASKPPLLTWMAAVATLAFGHVNRFAVHYPSALALIGVALSVLAAGRRYFGWRDGFLAGLMCLLSAAGDQQMMTARYDGLLSLPVTLAALAAFRAWSQGRGWTWFWLAAAIGTLAKGPIALVLGGAGLLAHFWERRSGNESHLRGSHWLGVLLYLALCGGWFLLAYLQMGQPMIDKMLGRELAAHALGSGRKETMLLGFYEPPVRFLTSLAPWSVLACAGFYRIWKRPAPEPEARRFERFVACWFFSGLLLFSIAAHQRTRLIYPLLPAAALIAGRELALWLELWSPARVLKAARAAVALFLGAMVLYHHVLFGRSTRVQKTLGMQELATQVRSALGEQFPLVHVDTPFALQFYLNTAWPLTPVASAAELLQGEDGVFVAVSNFEALRSELGTNAPALHEFARWPTNGTPVVRIVSNRPLFFSDRGLAH